MKDIIEKLIEILGQEVADVCTIYVQESMTRWPNGLHAANYLVYVWPRIKSETWTLGNTSSLENVFKDAERLRGVIRQALGIDKPDWDPIEKGA